MEFNGMLNGVNTAEIGNRRMRMVMEVSGTL